MLLCFMNKICPVLLLFILVVGCRKDDSAFLRPDIASSGDNCLITQTTSPDGSSGSTVKYELDSIVTESVVKENGTVINAWYLTRESPKQFVFSDGGKDLSFAKTRIYLNDDGFISKEVGVIINDDGTLSDDPEEVNVFTYNDRKQLVHVDVGLMDEGKLDLTYDDKGRIERIVMHDGAGTDYWVYDKFTYLDQVKKDNFLSVALFGSLSSHFIPSLRNVYISGYEMSSPLASELNVAMQFSYKFDQGRLSEVASKVTTMGQTIETTLATTLSCK